jgi:hypothetical protein
MSFKILFLVALFAPLVLIAAGAVVNEPIREPNTGITAANSDPAIPR